MVPPNGPNAAGSPGAVGAGSPHPHARSGHPAHAPAEAARGERAPDRVVLRSYWKFMFAWPIILLGYVFWFAERWGWASSQTLCWVWGITLIVVLVSMGLDMGRNMSVFWIVLVTLFWVSIKYSQKVLGWTVFSTVHRYLQGLASPYPRDGALFISIVLSVVYLVMLVWVRLNQTWRFTNNQFEHIQFGRSDDSFSRGTKKVRVTYHDFFELLLCLSGTIVISNSTGTRDLRVIENVPLAPLRWRRIDRMLRATAVTETTEDDKFEGDDA